MKLRLLVLLLGFTLFSFFKCSNKEPGQTKLIWADEFNEPGHPDSTKWSYEEGYIRNNEEQYYTNKRLENVRVEGGYLIIETRKDNYNGHKYTSGSINTKEKAHFEGDLRVEVKAVLPQIKGIWPAIWMMGTNISSVGWPKCSELDIMEFVGNSPNVIHSTMHWYDNTKNDHTMEGATLEVNNLHGKFHTYALERRGDSIKTFVDDECYFRFKVPESAFENSFTSPLYLLLNTALGGSWGGEIEENFSPEKFIIDYVRIYSLK